MLLKFFQNACILITFLSLIQHFARDKNIFEDLSINKRIIIGIYSAILGVILMVNSVPLTDEVIIDFRYVPIFLSAIYCGYLPSVISSLVIGIFRFLFFGVSISSIVGLISALLIGIGFGFISSLKVSRRIKYIYCMILISVISTISLIITLEDLILIFQSLIMLISGYLIVSYFSIKYTDYIIDIIEIYQKLKKEATKDYLTGLNNVRQFNESFNKISQLTIRKGEELSILIIDVDFFKNVNDTYGHEAGDIILKSLAKIFLDTCRSYDVISRMGGEEFSILLLNCPRYRAFKIAERIRKNVENTDFFISDNKSIKITISIGISSYPELTNEIESLLKGADTALYEAKNSGRNRVMF
ncbi:MAG: diguanylate cyclase, partial [Clostridium sp.]|uniref:GGDEF domain-containing protein n=1 Tax=Clostridium sp. TaxID=1506 RepID=UPI002913843C